MNLLARILSHGFALAVVVLIAVALMYRGDLFPEWQLPDFLVIEDDTSTGTDAASGAADSTPTATAAASTESSVTVPAEAPQVEVTAQDVAPPAEEAVADMDMATAESGPATTAVVEDVADTTAALEEPVVGMADSTPEAAVATGTDATGSMPDKADQAEVTETMPPASATTSEGVTEQAEATRVTPPVAGTASEDVPEQVDSPAQEVETSTPVAVPAADSEPEPAVAEIPVAAAQDSDGKNAYALLAAAREAYWLHNIEMAETHYQQLIELEPDNPDGYGELGNMYFAQGQWEQAAAAFYEAGVRLLEGGMVAPARQMVNVIRGLNGAQADDLEKQINTGH